MFDCTHARDRARDMSAHTCSGSFDIGSSSRETRHYTYICIYIYKIYTYTYIEEEGRKKERNKERDAKRRERKRDDDGRIETGSVKVYSSVGRREWKMGEKR